jgi:hypothetical protein
MTDLSDFDRSSPLDAAARRTISKLLPNGAELVEGDFADDEKWRIVNATETEVGEIDTPVVGSCHVCGGKIREHEPRVTDTRGVHHDGCYVQPARPSRKK